MFQKASSSAASCAEGIRSMVIAGVCAIYAHTAHEEVGNTHFSEGCNTLIQMMLQAVIRILLS